jgi:hypothetical protein
MAESDLEFRIVGPESEDNEVPASVLLQALESLQQLVWQFAFHQEGKPLKQRLKFSADLKERFALRLTPPEKGSYLIKARVGSGKPDLLDPVLAGAVVRELTRFCQAAVEGKIQDLASLLPDHAHRRRALATLRSLAPLPGSGYRFELQNRSGPVIGLNETLQAELSRFLLAPEEDAAELTQVVTGKLIEINFDDHQLTLLYLPTNRQLTCEYQEDVEPMLFENRRDLIQVRGKVRLGTDNHPEKIVEADYIGDLDLAPFALRDMEFKGLRLRFRQPRVVAPKLDESQQFIRLEDPDLNLSACARLRTELFEEVRACLHMLWMEYAREDDEKLEPEARTLKQRLLAALEEVSCA